MQFTLISLAIAATSFTSALGNTHGGGLCANWVGYAQNYDEAATKKACDAYRASKGAGYSACQDCALTGTPPTCVSASWAIGGKEMTSYCQAAGADMAVAS